MTVATKPNAAKKKVKSWRAPDSIFFKCLIVLTVSTLLTIGAVTFKSIQATEAVALKSIMTLGAEVTEKTAARIERELRDAETGAIPALLQSTLASLDGNASGVLFLSADGALQEMQTAYAYDTAPLVKTAQDVLASGQPAENPDRLVLAHPVRSAQTNEILGVLALDWRTDVLYAIVESQNRFSFVLATALSVVMLIFAGLLMKTTASRPLVQIARSMEQISLGNYDVEVPRYRRGNEVGLVVRTLEKFRDQLKSSAGSIRDAHMKSTALDAGSAAIMIADADFKIVYASKSVLKILSEHSAVIRKRIPSFDCENVVGQSIDMFHKDPSMQRKMLEAISPSGHDANLEMDDITLELRISVIDGEDGERQGYVVEWGDVTEERLNSAVLSSLNANQARAEFDPSGRLVAANDIFLKVSGLESVDQAADFNNLLSDESDPVAPDAASFSEFTVHRPDGSHGYVLGGVSPVLYADGSLKRTVVIGADVTKERLDRDAAQSEREARQAEQRHMITSLSASLEAVAQGDLTVEIEQPFAGENDRVREDFNLAVRRLREAIGSVEVSAITIRSEIEGVASASKQLAKRTESQAATLEETAAAMSQINASVSSSASGAKDANAVVRSANDKARSSEGIVSDAVNAMERISEGSNKITAIVNVIDDIAFQTNLLALNAGVEAARAGDAGRGFAVVASEVRALALRSAEAAREISDLINSSAQNVELGVELVGKAGAALESIIGSISDISAYVDQITTASQEQSDGIAEINSAMNHLDDVTQENAAMFEETQAASENLLATANDLSVRVESFTTHADGGSSHGGNMVHQMAEAGGYAIRHA